MHTHEGLSMAEVQRLEEFVDVVPLVSLARLAAQLAVRLAVRLAAPFRRASGRVKILDEDPQ